MKKGDEEEKEFDDWTSRIDALSAESTNAARLYAFFVAQDRSVDPDIRKLMLLGALQITESEFEECLDLLEKHGLGRVRIVN